MSRELKITVLNGNLESVTEDLKHHLKAIGMIAASGMADNYHEAFQYAIENLKEQARGFESRLIVNFRYQIKFAYEDVVHCFCSGDAYRYEQWVLDEIEKKEQERIKNSVAEKIQEVIVEKKGS